MLGFTLRNIPHGTCLALRASRHSYVLFCCLVSGQRALELVPGGGIIDGADAVEGAGAGEDVMVGTDTGVGASARVGAGRGASRWLDEHVLRGRCRVEFSRLGHPGWGKQWFP